MKIFYITLILLVAQVAWSSEGQDVNYKSSSFDAVYIVPTSPELVEYSRLKMKVLEAYDGDRTQVLTYIFPEILVGEKNKVIRLFRIPNTENSWKSEELTAHCTTVARQFSCNVYLNKEEDDGISFSSMIDLLIPRAHGQASLGLDLNRSLSHLTTLGLSPIQEAQFSRVIEDFFSGEPAGIFSYHF